ncbi:MAG: PilZ domain-containing protein [Bacteroidota bacterium]
MIEKRKFSRVDFKKEVEIFVNSEKYLGEIENLSLKGAYLKTTHPLQLDDKIEIIIHLTVNTDFDVNLKGKVIRLTNDGAGIIFDRIDLDSFSHLRNIIAYNFGDDDLVMEEFFNSINNKD